MKDLHSHLLFGIDDGSKSLDESICLLKKMQEQNITDLICTPHYIENSKYVCNNKDKLSCQTELDAKSEVLCGSRVAAAAKQRRVGLPVVVETHSEQTA